MEFLHGKIYVIEDKKYVFIFSNTWWEKAESNYSIFFQKKQFPCVKKKAYIVSRHNSSFVDFPGVITDSKKEALLEQQPL